jgi:hypothetical protein
MKEKMFGISEAGAELGISPKKISQAFWDGRLNGQICSRVAGRRIIPESYLPEIVVQLKTGTPLTVMATVNT